MEMIKDNLMTAGYEVVFLLLGNLRENSCDSLLFFSNLWFLNNAVNILAKYIAY